MSVSTKNRIPSSGLFAKSQKSEESMSYHNSFINTHEKRELNYVKFHQLMKMAGSKQEIRENKF